MKQFAQPLLLAYCLILLAFLFFATPTYAQLRSTEVSSVYDLKDDKTVNGDIIIYSKEKELVRADAPYDVRIFGILQNDPLLVYRRIDNTGLPIVRSGLAEVNISTLNGNIAAGDYITSSEIPGVGQKALQSGYVIGIALTPFAEKDGQLQDYTFSYSPNNPKKIAYGKITAAIRIEYAELTSTRSSNRLFSYFSAALMKNIQDPQKFSEIFRYIAAGLVIIISFAVGFVTFTRSIPKSIEAIGRNPLAANTIRFSIILNIIFTALISLVGIVAAVIIVKI